jgi:energy-coupling factor transporter ATP-binding protein EcfA2
LVILSFWYLNNNFFIGNALKINLNGIVIIVGNYGSGKTEAAVNLAIVRKQAGLDVRLADLDLVNPYFRSREARIALAELGIEIVLPPAEYMNADLPILSPAVAGMLRAPSDLALVDAGGDDAGVMVIAALQDALRQRKVSMVQVINPFRPFTENVKGCIKVKEEIEATSKLRVTGIVSNANLIDDTTPEIIYKGYELIQDLSEKTGLKVEFITAETSLVPELDLKKFDCPVLPIERYLVPPWRSKTTRS